MKNLSVKLIAIVCFVQLLLVACSDRCVYKDPSAPLDARVKDLVDRMTIDEKINQLFVFWGKEVASLIPEGAVEFDSLKTRQTLGDIGGGIIYDLYPINNVTMVNEIQKYAVEKTRLGIPLLFQEEALHGYQGEGGTVFPIPLGIASAWDTTLVSKMARVIGTECRAFGVHMALSPVLCLSNDPRWGRIGETYGEDPFLSSTIGSLMVKGMQTDDLARNDAVACELKHFAVHGIPEAGSNWSHVNIGEREARTTYLSVFEKVIKEADPQCVMAAYNEIDGIPCVVNKWLLSDLLRDEWGFDGYVMSDLTAIRIAMSDHRVAEDTVDVLSKTFLAGMNMPLREFELEPYRRAIKEALRQGRLSEKDLDNALDDFLRVKFRLGLFENPYVDTTLYAKVGNCKKHRDIALELARKSICLLKNSQDVLPLENISGKRIAVIGELAKSTYLGGYSTSTPLNGYRPGKGISVLDGILSRTDGRVDVDYAQGYKCNSTGQPDLLKQAVKTAGESDIIILVLGEDGSRVGEGKDLADVSVEKCQIELLDALTKLDIPLVVVLLNGRPLILNDIDERASAIVEAWFPGEMTGYAVADILLGRVNPSGKTVMTFPRSMGQIPIYYNHMKTSWHNYVDENNTPLYAFGHGLSYTDFEYSDMEILQDGREVTVVLDIENVGNRYGEEVVQCYICDEVSSVVTPSMKLAGFLRVPLDPGETKRIKIPVSEDVMSLWNVNMERVVEPGLFKVMLGASSSDIRLTGTFDIR